MRLFGSSCDFFYLYQHIPAHSGHHLLQSPSGMGASIFILQPHHVFIHSTPTGSTQLANGTSSTPQASTYSNGLQPKNAMASTGSLLAPFVAMASNLYSDGQYQCDRPRNQSFQIDLAPPFLTLGVAVTPVGWSSELLSGSAGHG